MFVWRQWWHDAREGCRRTALFGVEERVFPSARSHIEGWRWLRVLSYLAADIWFRDDKGSAPAGADEHLCLTKHVGSALLPIDLELMASLKSARVQRMVFRKLDGVSVVCSPCGFVRVQSQAYKLGGFGLRLAFRLL